MPKILIAECKQEVSTFNPHLSGYSDFVVRRGVEILDYHRKVRNEMGGALEVFSRESDLEIFAAYSAFFITSGGTLSKAGWKRIASEFLDSLRQVADCDGVYFCMHGAMASEEELDPEGYLLAEARRILGEKIPIVVSLDLHGILTEQMVQHANAIVAYHTYPHVDFFQTGQRAARLLLRILKGEVQPVTAVVPIPALVRGDELITETGLFGQCVRKAQQLEASGEALSAGMFIGNPFTDVPSLQTYSFVVTDNDALAASKEALELAKSFWSHHEQMRMKLTPVAEAVRLAHQNPSGTIALVDPADATSSGASGDSNVILKALIESGYSRRALIPIVDPSAVQAACAAGIGATIQVNLGGALDPGRFTPTQVTAKVRSLSDGHFRSESFGENWYSGPTAVLQVGDIMVVVSSRPVNLYDRSFFYANGQTPKAFDLVVVKSPHCQHHMYADWCATMVNVDAPGSSSANLPTLGHKRCPRPIFPLDPNVTFNPEPKIFQRQKA